MPRKGNIESRIEDLEERIHPQANTSHEQAERLVEKFMQPALDAMAHIHRASIDPPQWRYEAEALKEESSFGIAAYLAALICEGHPDERRARKTLAEAQAKRGADASSTETMHKLIEIFVRVVEDVEGEGVLANE
jgi:hypothetical protein